MREGLQSFLGWSLTGKRKALLQKRLDPDSLPSIPLWTSQPLKAEVVTFLSLFMLSSGMTAWLCVPLSYYQGYKCPHWHLPVTAGCNSLLPSPRLWLSLGLAQGLCSPSKLEHHIACFGFPVSDPQRFPHNLHTRWMSLPTESPGGGVRGRQNLPISTFRPLPIWFSFLLIHNVLFHMGGEREYINGNLNLRSLDPSTRQHLSFKISYSGS